MDTQRRWIGYDTLKLIVALVLLVLLLILQFQKPAVAPAVSADPENKAGDAQALASTQTPTALSPTSTLAQATPTLAQPSATPTVAVPTATATPLPLPTATLTPAAVEPTPTAALAEQPTATPEPEPLVDCPLAQPSRLSVGQMAKVILNLNMREGPGIDKQILRVSLPNSEVKIIGGPVCTPYQKGAYLWWNIQTADGVNGWSAEASLMTNSYFLEPIP